MTALMTALGTDLVMVRHGPTAWNREKPSSCWVAVERGNERQNGSLFQSYA